jgi:hypothetical protein
VTVAERTEVLAGVGRVVMAARRNTSRWLTIWPIAGAAIDGHVMARLNEGQIFLPVGL